MFYNYIIKKEKKPRPDWIPKKFTKILTHPDKIEITQMLLEGKGVRQVVKFLKEKYPNDKKMHISLPTIEYYRKEKLNMDGEAVNGIKEIQKMIQETEPYRNAETEIKQMPLYKQKLKEAVDQHIDIRDSLNKMYVLIESRMEELFNRNNGKLSVNDDQNLQRYLQSWIAVIEKWAKYIEKIADHTVETNVNITVIENQMAVIRDCIRETFNEVNPELAIKFFEKLEMKMSMLSYRPERPVSIDEIGNDVKVLVENFEGENDE